MGFEVIKGNLLFTDRDGSGHGQQFVRSKNETEVSVEFLAENDQNWNLIWALFSVVKFIWEFFKFKL